MLKLYKALEDKVTSDKTPGIEKARCAEIAANIAIDVLKMESEGIRAVKELSRNNVTNQNTVATSLNNLRNENNNDIDSDESFKECDPNRKF